MKNYGTQDEDWLTQLKDSPDREYNGQLVQGAIMQGSQTEKVIKGIEQMQGSIRKRVQSVRKTEGLEE